MGEDELQNFDEYFKSTQSNTNTSIEESIQEGKEDSEENMLSHIEKKNIIHSLKKNNIYLKDVTNSKSEMVGLTPITEEMILDFNNILEDSASQIMKEIEKKMEEKKKKFPLKKTGLENKLKFLTKKQRTPKLQKIIQKENIIGKRTKKKSGRHTSNIRKKPHNKKSMDNIMRKIKVHIIQDKIRNSINEYLKAKKFKKRLIKLSTKDINCLKKDENEKLMEKTLKEIYKEYNFCKKTKCIDPRYNEKLIDEIYANKDLEDLQNLLNLKYMEFYKIYTVDVIGKILPEDLAEKKKGIENLLNNKGQITDFIDKLEKKYRKDGETEEEINEYINLVKDGIKNYEKWF